MRRIEMTASKGKFNQNQLVDAILGHKIRLYGFLDRALSAI